MAGSVQKTGDASWKLTVSCGFDSAGKRIRKTKTVNCKSEREAKKELALFVAEIEKGQYIDAKKTTFSDIAALWLKDYAEKHLAPKTLYRYKQLLETRIIPAIGHLQLQKLQPPHLLSFYNNLAEPGIRMDGKETKGLSERTILHHHRLIHTILESAVQWQYLLYNPASRVKSPKVNKKTAAVYDQEQTSNLLLAAQSEPPKYQTIILLAIATGMRQGEIMGLTWKHIDFENNTISVEQAAQYLPGKGFFLKEPKNESSKRLISVPASVVNLLRAYKKGQAEERLQLGDKWQASDMVFTTWDGRPMFPIEMSSWFPRFLKRHSLPHLPFHGLRHTSATLLIAEGATATDLSKRLGHSTTSTTMNIYAHSLQKADSVLANKMDLILNSKTH